MPDKINILFVIFIISIVIEILHGAPTTTESSPVLEDPKNCGYESCHPLKEGMVNVHIVPHTHDDVGWLKTVDQYYFGSKQEIQQAGVQYILDSVIEALRRNQDRRFIYVETAFLWQWWMRQQDFVKHNMKNYINNGQLEIIGGAWSMNDEATTHYQSTIDQFTWGFRKLNDTFGTCGNPKVGWQIDPFGHSKEMASIFSQLGFDGLLLGRIDYQDKKFRFESKTPEFVWRGSESLGAKSDLFTSVLYNTYAPPPGFCFDVLCTDEPIIDDRRSPDYNVDKRVDEFFEYIANASKVYATNNILITMGEDFHYQDANIWFKNLDKLIQYGNERQQNGSNYHLIYSTPSCYQKAVKDEGAAKSIQWTLKSDDFFPYASDANSYWTGYFTSRPTLKRYERFGNNYLQVCKQLYALADLGPEDWVDLNFMREAMGVMQHHDAITGTEKEHVAFDYARRLAKGFEECEFITATALSQLVTGNGVTKRDAKDADPAPEIPFQSCLLANVSQCQFTEEQDNFIVTIYNPLSRPVNYYPRLPVAGTAYFVTDPEGQQVPGDLMYIADSIMNIPGRSSATQYELIFKAENIPPLGFKSFYVRKAVGNHVLRASKHVKSFRANDIQVVISPETGKVSTISMNGKNVDLSQDFYYYRGAVGDNRIPANRSSGAYIFRPNGSEPIQISPIATNKLYAGTVVTELHQIFNEWTSQVLRIYNSENYVEFDWLVGPIPIDDVNGKEVITKYTTSLKSDSSFYTDSNGRETLKRVRNFRPTWQVEIAEPVAANYYPVTTKILIRDQQDDVEVAILTDRAQGGSSLKDGEIELMLHRNCLHDDAFGVGEALNETAFGTGLVARGSHYLILGPYLDQSGNNTIAVQEHDIIQRKTLEAWTFISPTNGLNFEEYRAKYKMEFAGVKNPLPTNVQILTLEPWKGASFLLRLEHVFEADENSDLSKPAVVDLREIFSPFTIELFNETSLGANEWIDSSKANKNKMAKVEVGDKTETLVRTKLVDKIKSYDDVQSMLKWNYLLSKYERDQTATNGITNAEKSHNKYVLFDVVPNDPIITLMPMEIRTFVIEVKML